MKQKQEEAAFQLYMEGQKLEVKLNEKAHTEQEALRERGRWKVMACEFVILSSKMSTTVVASGG